MECLLFEDRGLPGGALGLAGEVAMLPISGEPPRGATPLGDVPDDPACCAMLERLAFEESVGCSTMEETRRRRLFRALFSRVTLGPTASGFLSPSLGEIGVRGALSTETREAVQRVFRRALARRFLGFFGLVECERFSLDRRSRGLEIVSGLAFLTAVLDGADPDRLGEGAAQIRELLSDVPQVRQLLHRGAFQSSSLAASDFLERAWGAGMAGARFMTDVLAFAEALLDAPAPPRRVTPPDGWSAADVAAERLRAPLTAVFKRLADQRRARGLA